MIVRLKFLSLVILLTLIQKAVSQSICTTDVCQREAEKIKSKMDTSVSPCEDFYQFSCGKFKPEIPKEKSAINQFTLLQDELLLQLNMSMSEPLKESDIEPVKNVKKIYRACMDKATINKIGIKHVNSHMKNFGGWPVVKSHKWDETKWSWQQIVQTMELTGFSQNYIVNFGLGQDFKNVTNRILTVDQPSLGLSREFLLKGTDEKLVKAYYSYNVDMAVIYGANKQDAEREMKEALNFEMALANITQSREERRDVTKLYNLITVNELQKLFPCLHWLNYMNAFIEPEKKIDGNEVILITSKKFYSDLNILLSKTPKRTIANYIMGRLALSSASLLSDNIRARQLKYLNALTGVQEFLPRWKECVSWTTSYLSIASSALYVRRFFNKRSKEYALEIVNAVQMEFTNILENTEWMDTKTKKFALEKAKKMMNYIGYPDELYDDKKLTEFYAGTKIDEKELFKSVLGLVRFSTKRAMQKFQTPVNKTDWEDHSDSAVVNAFYNFLSNAMEFPAGILHGHFFNADRPININLGTIGFVVGHEITHGFDDQGRKFDSDGNLFDWWEEETKEAYLRKAQCIVKQYGNYVEPTTQLKVNGILTQGENIGDIGGVLIAYRAYQRIKNHRFTDTLLPLQNFTSNQQFWIAAAQNFCSHMRVETMKLRITTDPHSPPIFRVNGPCGNSKEFLKDFQCSESSKMNLKNKCKVW